MALSNFIKVGFLTITLTILAACGTNPVTGQQEFQLVSQAEEISIGDKQYPPTKQAQGGELSEFNDLNAYINRVGQKIAKHSHRPDLPYEFVVLDNAVPNAWALPGGKIAINWGLLLEMDDEAELAAVLGHEIVHATARHGAKSMERGIAAQIALAGVMIGAATADLDSGVEKVLLGGTMLGSQLILTRYGRNAEYESDKYGIEYMAKAGYEPAAAVRLQETFVRLSGDKKLSIVDGLFASHPPSQDRVERNKVTSTQFNQYEPKDGWIVNRAEYQKMIEPIRSLKKSNEKIEQASVKIKDKDAFAALSLIDQAEDISPQSATPHAMRAIALEQQGKYQDAEREINKALAIRGDYFQFYELKAKIAEEQGDTRTALSSLQTANNLLPTASNSYALGNLNLAAGNKQAAQQYFSAVANSNSQDGRSAARKLAKLEIAQQPGKYIRIQGQLDKNTRLYVGLQNRSPLTIRNATLEVSLPDGRRTTVQLPQPIASGKAVSIPTQLVNVDAFSAQNIRVRVNSITTD